MRFRDFEWLGGGEAGEEERRRDTAGGEGRREGGRDRATANQGRWCEWSNKKVGPARIYIYKKVLYPPGKGERKMN